MCGHVDVSAYGHGGQTCGLYSMLCVNICCWDGFNKESDWPIAEQKKVVGEEPNKRMPARRRGGVRGVSRRHEEKQDGSALLKKSTKACDKT